jgi:hypothetical protein
MDFTPVFGGQQPMQAGKTLIKNNSQVNRFNKKPETQSDSGF